VGRSSEAPPSTSSQPLELEEASRSGLLVEALQTVDGWDVVDACAKRRAEAAHCSGVRSGEGLLASMTDGRRRKNVLRCCF